MADNWQEMLGELRVAVKRENDVRDASFLDLTTNICGVEIRQMTPRDLIILDGIGNPLVSGRIPTVEQLAQFLWLLSPKFKLNSKWAQWRFGASIRNLNYIEAVQACHKYLNETFQDSPASSGRHTMPYASWCAHLIVDLGSPADAQKILNTPLRQLFQFRNVIRRRNDPDCPMHNPSDKVKGDYIRLMNARQSLVNVLNRRATN